jgi:hypothetical protein
MIYYSKIYDMVCFKSNSKYDLYESKLLIKNINKNLTRNNKLFLTICKNVNRAHIFIATNKKDKFKLEESEKKIKILCNIINLNNK